MGGNGTRLVLRLRAPLGGGGPAQHLAGGKAADFLPAPGQPQRDKGSLPQGNGGQPVAFLGGGTRGGVSLRKALDGAALRLESGDLLRRPVGVPAGHLVREKVGGGAGNGGDAKGRETHEKKGTQECSGLWRFRGPNGGCGNGATGASVEIPIGETNCSGLETRTPWSRRLSFS